MTQKRKKSGNKWLYILLVILWMSVIFYMSSRTGDDSSAVSNPITDFIVELFQKLRKDPADVRIRMTGVVEVMVRKGAHMTEYGILLALIMLAVNKISTKKSNVNSIVWSVVITFAYACSDELHQLFVAERAGRAVDVMIDMCGAVIALLIIQGTRSVRGRIVTAFSILLVIMALLLFLMLWGF